MDVVIPHLPDVPTNYGSEPAMRLGTCVPELGRKSVVDSGFGYGSRMEMIGRYEW